MSNRSAAPLVIKGIVWMGFIVERVEVRVVSSPTPATLFPSGWRAMIAPRCQDSTIGPRVTSTSVGRPSFIGEVVARSRTSNSTGAVSKRTNSQNKHPSDEGALKAAALHAGQLESKFVGEQRDARLEASKSVVRASQSGNSARHRLDAVLLAGEDVMHARVCSRDGSVFDRFSCR